MLRLLFTILLALLTVTSARAAEAPSSAVAPQRSLLVHAGEDRMWLARIVTGDAASAAVERTDILVGGLDPSVGKQDWKPFASVPARITAMANRGGELAVLLEDQTWMRIWSADGAAGGSALPAGGQIRTITNDAGSLWAIGSVRGGLYAALQAMRAQASTAPTTESSAAAASPEPEPSRAADSMPNKLVLFHERQGAWTPIVELPPDAWVPTTAPMQLAIIGGEALISFRSGTGSVRTLRFGSDFAWHEVGVVHAPDPAGRITDFALLSLGDRPLLWIAEGNHLAPGAADAKRAGWLALPAPDAELSAPVKLDWTGSVLPQSLPALVIVQNQLREFALHGERIYEQAYSAVVPAGNGALGSGAAGFAAPLGPAAQIALPSDAEGGPLQYGINTLLLVAFAFSISASWYRRRLMLARKAAADSDEPVAAPPLPAPLGPRLVAGLIDLLPIIAASVVLSVRHDAATDPLQQLSDNTTRIAICIASGVYLLYTTLTETFAGRTIGKWAMGLRPVTLAGAPPSRGQLLIRNLLRIIDLLWFPLLLVVISPLGQRLADVGAGTMVVRDRDAVAPAEVEAKESSAVK